MVQISRSEFLSLLKDALQNEPEIIGLVWKLASEKFATKQDVVEILQELKSQRLETTRRFEDLLQKFDEQREEFKTEMEKQREDTNRRFEKLSKRIEKQREEIIKSIKKHYEMNKERIDILSGKIEDLGKSLGVTFEDFVRVNLTEILVAAGILDINQRLESVHFKDPEHKVNLKTDDVQIDLFCENPLIVGEVTESLVSIEKFERLIKRIIFITEKFGRKPDYTIFVTKAIKLTEEDEKYFKMLSKKYDVLVINTEKNELKEFFPIEKINQKKQKASKGNNQDTSYTSEMNLNE